MEGVTATPGGRRLVKRAVLAQHLGVSDETITSWVRRELIPPPIRVNQRVHLYDLDAALEQLQKRGGAA